MNPAHTIISVKIRLNIILAPTSTSSCGVPKCTLIILPVRLSFADGVCIHGLASLSSTLEKGFPVTDGYEHEADLWDNCRAYNCSLF